MILLISRELLEQIKDFEEQEFSGVASRDADFKPRLQPLNESGGSALLKIVHIHAFFWFHNCINIFPAQQLILQLLFNFAILLYLVWMFGCF